MSPYIYQKHRCDLPNRDSGDDAPSIGDLWICDECNQIWGYVGPDSGKEFPLNMVKHWEKRSGPVFIGNTVYGGTPHAPVHS